MKPRRLRHPVPGRCFRCGDPSPEGRLLCDPCDEDAREDALELHADVYRDETCSRCGTRVNVNPEVLVCEFCEDDAIEKRFADPMRDAPVVEP
jgi:predicted amidophosphoribosyltransferase